MALGKWIGGFLGLLSGGPLGMLAGVVLGALVDSVFDADNYFQPGDPGMGDAAYDDSARRENLRQGNRNGFLFSLMVLSAHIIHADRRVMHSEMEYVRRFLRTNFSADAEREGEEILLRLFDEKKRMGNDGWMRQIVAVCQQLAFAMPTEQRLQLIAMLCEIAKADGQIQTEEREALRQVCLNMGLDGGTAEQMLGLGGQSLDDAYRVLGLHPDASDDEVRQAYKRMARENHPDRVASLGEDIRRQAERKFQEIADAKDRIYKARGMK
ncbi:MAG: TerB family tellurite resistance protein [Bacteroidaceae bacterium]|nr:TerB family tellurite resistance protein [Bacteroidaceae bacterium]